MLTHDYSYFLKQLEKGAICTKGAHTEDLLKFSLRLFADYSVAPNVDSVSTDFTEVSGGGYAAKDITLASLTVTKGNGANQTTSSYAEQVFEFTAASKVVKGYYLTAYLDYGGGAATYVFAAYLDSTFTTTASGDKYKVTLHLDSNIAST